MSSANMDPRRKMALATGEVRTKISMTLERSLGLFGVIVICLSSMLGTGLFVLPAFVGEIAGNGIWLAYLLAASVVLPAALSKSELASAMPSSGGSYVYLERTFGRLFGTISGLGLWASAMLKSAVALIGFSAYMYVITTYFSINIQLIVISLSALVLITILNILGMKKIKAFQYPILGVTLALLMLVCIIQLFDPSTDLSRPFNDTLSTLKNEPLKIGEATAFVFVAYAGVTKVAAIGGEVKNPGRNLPVGIMLSLLISTALYVFVTFMIGATIPGEWWYGSDGKIREDSIYIFVEAVAGPTVGLIIAIMAILTIISMALAGILAASRFIFAMGKDHLLPQNLAEVHPKYETPFWPIVITSVAMGICILFMPVKDVAKLASGFKIMIFVFINACVMVLRSSSQEHDWYLPEYRSHFYPWIQWWGIIGGIYLLVIMGDKAVIGGGSAIILGLILYYGYGKSHDDKRKTPFQSFSEKMFGPVKIEEKRRRAAFHAADVGEKNKLNLQEFKIAVRALDFMLTSKDLEEIFHTIDLDKSGFIDENEFLEEIEKIAEEE